MLVSAPALSSDSTQGAFLPETTAKCSAVILPCREAAVAPHTRVSGGGRAGGRRMSEANATPLAHPTPPPPQPRSLPLPACMRAGRPRAGSRQRSGGAAWRRRGAAAPAGHRPPAGQRGSGEQPLPLSP
eukprot:scaffold51854_cov53-Phaeocystis_antarctica.AAC.5